MILKIKKLNNEAKIPSRAHDDDAGIDLFCNEELKIQPGEIISISTGISLEIPKNHVGLIWDKSGLAMKFGLKTIGGVIDSGYRGEIMVGMTNLGKDKYTFNKGDKVAQIIIQKFTKCKIKEVTKLSNTKRGTRGFGSSGKS